MRQKYNITGMTCAACSARVEKVTGKVPEVLPLVVLCRGV